ncbi:hypothetical protein [Streptomyces fulvoviolaceus]|nr:hypothetical protein [Streptomyces fulvoviolaceus]MCT9076407.1 hypothetical protein [Streptomyces fulvoviolaceus]
MPAFLPIALAAGHGSRFIRVSTALRPLAPAVEHSYPLGVVA